MSKMLEKGRQQVEAGKYKAAIGTLVSALPDVRRRHDIEGVQVILDLASQIGQHTTGTVRDRCDALAGYALAVLEQAPGMSSEEKANSMARGMPDQLVTLGMADYLGGNHDWRPSKPRGEVTFTPKDVVFAGQVLALMPDVASIEIGIQQQTSMLAPTFAFLAFGVVGGLLAQKAVDRTDIGVHLKSGAALYFRVLTKDRNHARAMLRLVLRQAGVPFLDEVKTQSQRPEVSPMHGVPAC